MAAATSTTASDAAAAAAQEEREHIVTSSARDDFKAASLSESLFLSIVVFGASGDLACKKTYPALYALYYKKFFPASVQIVGYARSSMTDESLRDKIRGYLPKENPEKVERFLQLCTYVAGPYGGDDGYAALRTKLEGWEQERAGGGGSEHLACSRLKFGRLMYLALPPVTYPEVCAGLKKHIHTYGPMAAKASWFRVIMEKPFGFDLDTSEALAETIGGLLAEEHIYRIDHYLGKELVQNMLMLRFANMITGAWWNRHCISNVQITFKEDFGTQGRGGYFDQYGIVRDVIQNHLIQVLALLTMEAPVSLHPDDVRDEKVKVLRYIAPVKVEDCILGQYTAGGGQPGYLEDPTVPAGSRQATYAAVKCFINNDRWAGVPFVIKAGKALNEKLALVRIQFKTPAASIFGDLSDMRNELVIKFQPGEAIYAKLLVKRPGLEVEKEMSELDLTYPDRYKDIVIPDAYERLILDCIRGDQQHFVRRDELRAAWAIFTPLLHAIDAGSVPLEQYEHGSRGPASVDEWTTKAGYIKTHYHWKGGKDDKPLPKGGASSSSSDDEGEGAAGAAAAAGSGAGAGKPSV